MRGLGLALRHDGNEFYVHFFPCPATAKRRLTTSSPLVSSATSADPLNQSDIFAERPASFRSVPARLVSHCEFRQLLIAVQVSEMHGIALSFEEPGHSRGAIRSPCDSQAPINLTHSASPANCRTSKHQRQQSYHPYLHLWPPLS